MQATRKWILSFFVGVAIAGCGDAFGPDTMTGTWNVVSVNGSPVPGVVPVYDAGHTVQVEIFEWWLRFDTGSTCVFHIDFADEDGYRDSGTEDECTWTVDVEAKTAWVNIYDFGSDTYQVSGNTMTLLTGDDGNVWVYRKE
jgi:hypothetical protein